MFHTHEIYTKRLGSGEEFDAGCMCISSFGEAGSRFIVIGSFAGILRVFTVPSSFADAKAEAKRGDNAMLEERLSAPILQVSAGRLVSTSERLCLAVLHSRKLVVFSVSTDSESAKSASGLSLKVAYEHALARTASNMVIGTIGTSTRRDFICVQSADCTLTVFEQETPVFTCFPSDCLLPSRFAYLRATDSFVLAHGDAVKAYRHRTLAASGSRAQVKNEDNAPRTKADWTVILGETCVDMGVCEHPDAEGVQSVVCVSRDHVFCVADSGKLRFVQKLAYEPVSLFVYNASRPVSHSGQSQGELSVNYIIGTRSDVLLVYENSTLKWACRADFSPVQISVTNLGTLQGVLVLLAEHGIVTLTFLGTEPSIAVRGALRNGAALSSDQQSKMAEELRSLQRVVRETATGNANVLVPKPSAADDELTLQLNVTGDEAQPGVLQSATLNVTLRSRSNALANVDISAVCRPPLRIAPLTVTHFRTFDSRSAASQNFVVFRVEQRRHAVDSTPAAPHENDAAVVPTDLRVVVCGTYSSSEMEQAGRVAVAHARLPLVCIAQVCTAQKDAQHKVTFSVSESLATTSLSDLFRDLLGTSASQLQGVQGGSVLGLRLCLIEQPVSILATRNKFRVQSDRADLLYLPLRTLADRLQASASGLSLSGFQLHGRPPVEMLTAQVEVTFELRLRTIEMRTQLAKHATLFREIQKRAFSKFREDAPNLAELADLNASTNGAQKETLNDDEATNLENLLDDAHAELLRSVDELSQVAHAYRAALSSLESTLRLLALCSQFALAFGSAELRALECVLLIEHVATIADQPLSVAEPQSVAEPDSEPNSNAPPPKLVPGWEELVNAVLMHVLKQSGASGKSDRIEAGSLQIPKSAEKLCRVLNIFFEKLLNKQVDLTQIGSQMSLIAPQSSASAGADASTRKTSSDKNAAHARSVSENDKANLQTRLDTVNRITNERETNSVQSPRSLLEKLPKVEQPNARFVPSNLFGGALNRLKADEPVQKVDEDVEPQYSTPSKVTTSRSELAEPSIGGKQNNEEEYF